MHPVTFLHRAAAFAVGCLLGLALLRAVGRGAPLPPPAPRWLARALTWLAAGVVGGPVLLGGLAGLLSALFVAEGDERFFVLFGGWLLGGDVLWGTAFAIGLPFYLPIVLAWARAGSGLGAWERRRWGIAAGGLVLALVMGAMVAAFTQWASGPFGPDRETMTSRLMLACGASWLGFLAPRLLIPSLRVGAFASPDRGTA